MKSNSWTPKPGKGVTLVAVDAEVEGDVRFSDQLCINGRVKGKVSAKEDGKGTLVVSEEGSVEGEIRVPNVVINGSVEGNVFAGERVELTAKAKVSGNVYYKTIEMQLGAIVDGQMIHEGDPGAKVHPFPAISEDTKRNKPGGS
jgi:cytoskeletal protein CcmA (bactofilin family)